MISHLLKIIGLTLLLGMTPVKVFADAIDEAEALYNAGDYTRAFALYQKLADQGTPRGQTILGTLYYLGQGTTRDYAMALHWYRKAADQGYAAAQFNLGTMYSKGEGVKRDYKQAHKWYALAAKQKHGDALLNLGSLHEQGKGTRRNLNIAAKYYFASANLGDRSAQLRMAQMYEKGRGVPIDKARAWAWYQQLEQTAESDSRTAQQRIEESFTAEQRQQAQQLAKYISATIATHRTGQH